MRAQLSKMRAVAESLSHSLCWFEWTLLDVAEVRATGLRDPACRILRGSLGPFRIEVADDGETVLGFKESIVVLAPLDLSRPKATIVAALYDAVRSAPRDDDEGRT